MMPLFRIKPANYISAGCTVCIFGIICRGQTAIHQTTSLQAPRCMAFPHLSSQLPEESENGHPECRETYSTLTYTTQVMHSCGSEPTPHNWHPPNTIQYLCPECLHLISCYYMLCGGPNHVAVWIYIDPFLWYGVWVEVVGTKFVLNKIRCQKEPLVSPFWAVFPETIFFIMWTIGPWRKNVQSGLG